MAANNKNPRLMDFIIITIIFAMPFLMYWNNISQNLVMVTGDGLNIFTPTFFQSREILKGDTPLWNSYVITGVPFFADPNNSFFYPFHALALIFPPTLYSNLYYIIHVGMAGIFTYLFLKKSSKDRFTASLGACVVIFATFIGGFRREHVAVYTGIVWLPLILYFILSFTESGRKRYLLFSALAMTMQLFGGHPQYTFYSDFIAALYFVYNLIALKYPIKEAVLSLFLWVVSYVLFSAIFLIPVAELVMQSARFETSFFTLFSTKWQILLMVLFPGIFGNIFFPLGDYGSAEISIEIYLGIIPLIYALYAVRYHFSNRLVQFSVFAIIFSWLYSSWSTFPLVGPWLQNIPGFNFFDVQSRILFIYVFFGIFCFAIGVSDIRYPNLLKRLLNHSLLMAAVLAFASLIISSVRLSPILGGDPKDYYSFFSKVFLYTNLIACFNALLIGTLFFIRKRKVIFTYASFAVAATLLVVNAADVGRFALMHNTASLHSLVNTEETKKLGQLLGDAPYRIITVYDNPLKGAYGTVSGLRENLSMNNYIRNLKGRTEFENPQLDELLDQTESRENRNIWSLLSDGRILSMLSVKYVLVPLEEHAPYAVPTAPETEILSEPGPAHIPGSGELTVLSYPMSIEPGRYYQVEFDMNMPGKNVPMFYVDLFGGADYDSPEQDRAVELKRGDHTYRTIIYAGDPPINAKDIFFRIVSSSYEPLEISNLRVVKLVPPVANQDYIPVAKTNNYKIYENTRAQKLLYIPDRVVSVKNPARVRRYPQNYPNLDRVSYVEGVEEYNTAGTLEILSVTNDCLTARVSSEDRTFVNHAQSFYPGWKASIDGQLVPIHLVNGVIQGMEVPPGEHIVEFIYDPLSLKLGAVISIVALCGAIGYIFYENRRRKARPVNFEGVK